MVCGIEASYIPDMLVQYPVIALVLGSASDSRIAHPEELLKARPGYGKNGWSQVT